MPSDLLPSDISPVRAPQPTPIRVAFVKMRWSWSMANKHHAKHLEICEKTLTAASLGVKRPPVGALECETHLCSVKPKALHSKLNEALTSWPTSTEIDVTKKLLAHNAPQGTTLYIFKPLVLGLCRKEQEYTFLEVHRPVATKGSAPITHIPRVSAELPFASRPNSITMTTVNTHRDLKGPHMLSSTTLYIPLRPLASIINTNHCRFFLLPQKPLKLNSILGYYRPFLCLMCFGT